MSLNEIRLVFLDIVRGVHFIHEMGFAHLDIKLNNVLVSHVNGKLTAKISDLGSMVKLDSETQLMKYARGTIMYSSPEVLLENPYQPKAQDIW
jgi:serine/threonine protein kinase